MNWDKEINHLGQSLNTISVEELQEQADEVDYLTPREFAKLIGVKPQQVYMWIRKGVLEPERCQCGRTLVRVSKSKAIIQARKIARGQILDNRPDGLGNEGLGLDVQGMSSEDIVPRT
jgi:excisionase family DNA binding protein